jgi:hypothetical protein
MRPRIFDESYLDGGRAHRDIDDDGIVIEIGFVATAMSSVEEAQSGNHPPPSGSMG